MAPPPTKTPKSELNDWCLFTTEGAHKPVYHTEGDSSKPPTYRSILTLPDGRKFESEWGHKKKKDAEQEAAERAMQAVSWSWLNYIFRGCSDCALPWAQLGVWSSQLGLL